MECLLCGVSSGGPGQRASGYEPRCKARKLCDIQNLILEEIWRDETLPPDLSHFQTYFTSSESVIKRSQMTTAIAASVKY